MLLQRTKMGQGDFWATYGRLLGGRNFAQAQLYQNETTAPKPAHVAAGTTGRAGKDGQPT